MQQRRAQAEREDVDLLPDDLNAGLVAGFEEVGGTPPRTGRDPPHGPQRRASQILLRDAPEEEAPLLRVGPPGDGLSERIDGRYEILGEIARGAVGVIYKARDRELGRELALKVLREDRASDLALVERFVEEAQIEGQLQHPGIVPVYGLGLHADGRPFIAMKLVKGRTLSALLRDRRTPSEHRRRFLGFFERLCQAIAYAHARGVLHRDLKPSNVLIGAFGDVQVVDWGFAKVIGRDEHARGRVATGPADSVIRTVRTGSEGSESLVGSVMGTPAYMPPEQALGLVDRIDARSDVFALGAILCEILTGAPPYSGEAADLLAMAAQGRMEEAHARLKRSGAHPDMQALCRKALSPLKPDRPANAGHLARYVHEHLAQLEEEARKAELKAARDRGYVEENRLKALWERRARRRTAVIAGVLLGTAVLIGGTLFVREQAQGRRVARAAAEVEELAVTAEEASASGDLVGAIAAMKQAVDVAVTRSADAETLDRARTLLGGLVAQQDEAEAARSLIEKDRRMARALEDIRYRLTNQGDSRGTDAAYARAFSEYGIDVHALDLQAAAERIRTSTIADELVVTLDRWSAQYGIDAIREREFGEELKRLVALADPDPLRARIRKAVTEEDAKAVEALAADSRTLDLPTHTSGLLATGLASVARDTKAAERVYRRVVRRRPGDFEGLLMLSTVCSSWAPTQPDDALRYSLAALAVQPLESVRLYLLVGNLLDLRGDQARAAIWHEAAEALAERMKEREPERAVCWAWLGTTRSWLGKDEQSVDAFERAAELDPENEWAWWQLSTAHLARDDWDDAMSALETALGLADDERVWQWIGYLHAHRGDYEDAKRCYGEAATRLLKDHERGALRNEVRLMSLSTYLSAVGAPERAVELSTMQTRLWPESPAAWRQHGTLLCANGRVDEGLDAFRRGMDLRPGLPGVQHSYAHLLFGLGRAKEGLAANSGEASCEVVLRAQARLLEKEGDADAARAAYVKAHEHLLEKRKSYVEQLRPIREFHSDQERDRWWVSQRIQSLENQESMLKERQMLVAAVRKVAPRLFAGETEFDSTEELFAAGKLEWNRGRLVSALRFTRDALARSPTLGSDSADGILASSARLACLAAAGDEGQSKTLTAEERSSMRRQAVAWLRLALEGWRAKIVKERTLRAQRSARNTVLSWMSPGNRKLNQFPLPERYEGIPIDERADWEHLWNEARAFVRSTWKGGRP